jgi:hypothetical protein
MVIISLGAVLFHPSIKLPIYNTLANRLTLKYFAWVEMFMCPTQ